MPTTSQNRPRLTLGPILYHWPRELVLDFYAEMLETPVDVIYLGETICSKRRLLRPEDYWELAERVAAAGKEPVIPTLALIESDGELKTLQRLCADERFLIEANDLAGLDYLEGRPSRPLRLKPFNSSDQPNGFSPALTCSGLSSGLFSPSVSVVWLSCSC